MIVAAGDSEGMNVDVGGVSQSGVDVHTALDSGGGKAESTSPTAAALSGVALHTKDGMALEVGAANVKVELVGIAEYELCSVAGEQLTHQ